MLNHIRDVVLGSPAPLPIKLIAWYWVITGLWALATFVGAVYFAGTSGSLGTEGVLISFVYLIGIAIGFLVAYELFKMTLRGFWWAVIFIGLTLVTQAPELSQGKLTNDFLSLAFLVIGVAMLVYLVTHKNLFQKPSIIE